MEHIGIDIVYGTLLYWHGLWNALVLTWFMEHFGIDMVYGTLWYWYGLWNALVHHKFAILYLKLLNHIHNMHK